MRTILTIFTRPATFCRDVASQTNTIKGPETKTDIVNTMPLQGGESFHCKARESLVF